MKNLWAIVPVKPFGEGKSRLAPQLNNSERGELSKQLLTRVIEAGIAADICTKILVISRDDHVLAYARSLGVSALQERSKHTPSPSREIASHHDGNPSQTVDYLNLALRQGADAAMQEGADALLVLPADLPMVTPADLTELAQAGQQNPCVVIAPSEDNGTNALLLNPADCIDFAFGIDSFSRHQAQAHQKNIPFKIIHSATLAFDVDRPADLDKFSQMKPIVEMGVNPWLDK